MSDDLIFDVQGTMERVENDGELLLELVSIFFEDYDSQIEALEKAISADDAKGIEGTAHSLKSALGNIGASVCFQTALTLEKAGKNGLKDSWEGLLGKLKEDVRQFQEAFETKKEELSSLS